MATPRWLTRWHADVPAGDGWLGAGERRVLAGLRIAPRRDAWRLGRWTAKSAASAFLALAPERIEILAAADGAPEVWVSGERAAVSLSLSHRAGRALAVVAAAPAVVGCDLEVVEPRSDAFVQEWLAASEQAFVAGLAGDARDRAVNTLWTAKEAVAKVRREGLRLDVRHAVVDAQSPGPGWRRLRVDLDGDSTAGWWREEPGWVMSVAGEGAPAQPCPLDGVPRHKENRWLCTT
jgi:4'-phosphopantetheinyl transferase